MTNELKLNDTAKAWHIEDGMGMLYLASTADASDALPRHFVCDLPPGAVVVAPMANLPEGWVLVCCVTHDTVVREDTAEALDHLDPMSKNSVEEWMKDVLTRLDPKGVWLSAKRKSVQAPAEFGAPERRVFSARVRAFADLLAVEMYARMAAQDERESARLLRSRRLDEVNLGFALGRMETQILAEDELGAVLPSDHDGDGLLAACRVLEQSSGVRFQPLTAEVSDDLADEDLIEALAEGSNLRSRRILLDGPWWEEEGGPLLARVSDNEAGGQGSRHWVALLPGKVSGYQLFTEKPIEGVPSGAWVTEEIAHRLAPNAFTFYRTFPKESLSAIDVVKFGVRGKQRDFAFLLLASLAAGALGLLAPIVSGWIIDQAIPAKSTVMVWHYIGGLFVAGLSVLTFDAIRTVAILRIEGRAGMSVQAAMLDRVISLPTVFFRRYSSGDLSLRMAAVNSIQQAITGSVIGTFLTSVFLISNFGLMFWYSPMLTGVVAVALVGVVFISGIIGFLRLRVSRRIESLDGKLQSMVYEYLCGINKIRTSASQKRAFVNWANSYLRFRQLNVQRDSLGNLEALLLNIVLPAMLLSVYFFASYQATNLSEGSFASTGQFIAFNAALFGLIGGTFGLMTTAMELVQLLPVWERARPIVEALPESSGKRNLRYVPSGGIEILDLGFKYPDGPDVLSEVSFNVAPGSFVAIVGASGSGKSTLVRLLLGFEQPTEGSICYDGHDIVGLDPRFLRSRIGTVLQSGQLWPGSIYSNIAGASNLPPEKVWRAIERAGLTADIEAMPMGLYTSIGDGDSTLSGGQKQRVLIARAIVNEPRILIMDEATSALDSVTQGVVQESLRTLKCTRVVIAHRLSTIRDADKVLVLDQGKVVEQGRFDQLASQDGPFAALLARQTL